MGNGDDDLPFSEVHLKSLRHTRYLLAFALHGEKKDCSKRLLCLIIIVIKVGKSENGA